MVDTLMAMRNFWVVIGLLCVSAVASADRLDRTISMLQSPNYKLRAQAALVLGKFSQQQKVIPPLVQATQDRHRAVRAAAVIALGKSNDIRALKAISNAVMDDDMRVANMARKSVQRVAEAIVTQRSFAKSRYSVTIAGIRSGTSDGAAFVGKLKEHIMGGLLKYENIDVGRSAFGDDGAKPDVELDLKGQILAISNNRCTLELTLALRPGGYVVSRWQSIKGRGSSPNSALQKAAHLGLSRVLKFLGAR